MATANARHSPRPRPGRQRCSRGRLRPRRRWPPTWSSTSASAVAAGLLVGGENIPFAFAHALVAEAIAATHCPRRAGPAASPGRRRSRPQARRRGLVTNRTWLGQAAGAGRWTIRADRWPPRRTTRRSRARTPPPHLRYFLAAGPPAPGRPGAARRAGPMPGSARASGPRRARLGEAAALRAHRQRPGRSCSGAGLGFADLAVVVAAPDHERTAARRRSGRRPPGAGPGRLQARLAVECYATPPPALAQRGRSVTRRPA